MRNVNLQYGKAHVSLEIDENRFEILGSKSSERHLTDAEIGEKLDNPIDLKPLEEIIKAGETVLIVVPDATRKSASGQIVNLLVRRLIANGTMAFEITIIFATGIHRAVTEEEKTEILTPFIAQRIKTLNHNARDLMQLIRLGETSGKVPIVLNRALAEHDHTIIIGAVNFHYFAGFTGGRKLICPGLASSKTINETHRLAFDCQTKARREGVDTGILDGNAVNEAFFEVAQKAAPVFSINSIVSKTGEAIELFCGDWITAHCAACDFYSAKHTIKIKEKRELVIASAGGFPSDLNMIQAHKALDAAARCCQRGGTIILLAECAEGLGRSDFLKWFEAENSEQLAENLCRSYQVNGQTAWNLLRITETFKVRILTSLDETAAHRMRIEKIDSPEHLLSKIDSKSKGYILPFGAEFLIKL